MMKLVNKRANCRMKCINHRQNKKKGETSERNVTRPANFKAQHEAYTFRVGEHGWDKILCYMHSVYIELCIEEEGETKKTTKIWKNNFCERRKKNKNKSFLAPALQLFIYMCVVYVCGFASLCLSSEFYFFFCGKIYIFRELNDILSYTENWMVFILVPLPLPSPLPLPLATNIQIAYCNSRNGKLVGW